MVSYRVWFCLRHLASRHLHPPSVNLRRDKSDLCCGRHSLLLVPLRILPHTLRLQREYKWNVSGNDCIPNLHRFFCFASLLRSLRDVGLDIPSWTCYGFHKLHIHSCRADSIDCSCEKLPTHPVCGLLPAYSALNRQTVFENLRQLRWYQQQEGSRDRNAAIQQVIWRPKPL